MPDANTVKKILGLGLLGGASLGAYHAADPEKVEAAKLQKLLDFGDVKLPLDAKGMATLYHATSPEAADKIVASKMLKSAGEPVAKLRGDEFPRFPKLGQLAQAVGDWWTKKYGNRIQNPELGEIIIDQRGAKSSVAHGMGAEKGAAFAAVPDILSKGKVLSAEERGGGNPTHGFILGAPVQIAGKDYVGLALVKRDANGQRFYLHEVVLKEKLQDPIKTAAADDSVRPHGGTAGAFRETLRRIFATDKPGDGRFSVRGHEQDYQRDRIREPVDDPDGHWRSGEFGGGASSTGPGANFCLRIGGVFFN